MNLASLISLTLKETRAALKSSFVMVMCLALGVMSITAVQTLSTSLKSTLAREGQVILGGDASLTLVGRSATQQELSRIESFGLISKQITMRSMVRMGDKVALTELKAVDQNYPLYGDFTPSDGALIEKALLIKLNAKVGDTLTLRGDVVRITKQVAFAQACVIDAAGDIVSKATGTFLLHREPPVPTA